MVYNLIKLKIYVSNNELFTFSFRLIYYSFHFMFILAYEIDIPFFRVDGTFKFIANGIRGKDIHFYILDGR